MLKRMSLIYRTLGEAFGARVEPLVSFTFFGMLRLGNGVGMALDPIVFPSLRRKRIASPIIVSGNPRSGTTFMHRFLHDQGLGTGMKVWQMLYPSLIVQKLLAPFMPLLEKLSPARHHGKEAHATGLTSVEADDASVYLRYLDGPFLYAFVLGWANEEHRDLVDPAKRDTSARDWAWLEKLWKRNLVANHGDRVVAKLFSLVALTPAFVKRYPDARILYMLRDPVDTIPSTISLVMGPLDKRFGVWKRPEELRKRYFERLYQSALIAYGRFHDDYTSGRIPKENLLVVRYDRMMSELETVMDEILAFIGVEPTPELTAAIAARAEKQRAYQSGHRYDLEKFGLDADRIRADLGYLYDTFGIPR